MTAVLILLNNYLHDLATAVLAVSAVAAWLLLRSSTAQRAPAVLRPVADGLVGVGLFALGWTLLGGVVRALAYREYEWMEAAGRNQVPALVVKPVILVAMVVLGLVMLYRVRRLVRTSTSGGAGA